MSVCPECQADLSAQIEHFFYCPYYEDLGEDDSDETIH